MQDKKSHNKKIRIFSYFQENLDDTKGLFLFTLFLYVVF